MFYFVEGQNSDLKIIKRKTEKKFIKKSINIKDKNKTILKKKGNFEKSPKTFVLFGLIQLHH